MPTSSIVTRRLGGLRRRACGNPKALPVMLGVCRVGSAGSYLPHHRDWLVGSLRFAVTGGSPRPR
ncbi:hypothetical protein I552_8451 [Mycobacterium xenopi 3993]|nr:hypothetical protein I552_8451 [Mycobacterium xenopi 3993]